MSESILRKRPNLRDIEAFAEPEATETRAKILSGTVDWKQYADSGHLTAGELGMLRDYDKQPADTQASLLDEMGLEYARLFVKVLANVATEQVVQYTLALVDQLLAADRSRARLFSALAEEQVAPYAPLLGVLRRHAFSSHAFAVTTASHVLAQLLAWRDVPAGSGDVSEFLSWCVAKLESARGAELAAVVSALKVVLRSPSARETFAHQCQGVRQLMALLRREQQSSQLTYNAVFCAWLLTFSESVFPEFVENNVVGRLVEVLSGAPREKILRVVFGTLSNLLDKSTFNEAMAVSGLMKLLPGLLARKTDDDDVKDAIQRVDETLQVFVRQLSSFDKYKAELETGSLQWTPVHNERFWRQCVAEFEANGFEAAKKLFSLLDSQDELTLEVACYDIGEFARFHPDGRRIVDRSGAKTRLMSLMSHSSAKVAKMALLSVQKLMVQHWESLAPVKGVTQPGQGEESKAK